MQEKAHGVRGSEILPKGNVEQKRSIEKVGLTSPRRHQAFALLRRSQPMLRLPKRLAHRVPRSDKRQSGGHAKKKAANGLANAGVQPAEDATVAYLRARLAEALNEVPRWGGLQSPALISLTGDCRGGANMTHSRTAGSVSSPI